MRFLTYAISVLLIGAFNASANADPAALTTKLFNAGTVKERNEALAELVSNKTDAAATYAAGAGQFLVALETLGQGLHRHGFESPQSMMMPLMRLPVPENADPEPLTYEGFRTILSEFRDGMARSAKTLDSVPESAEVGVEVDLGKLGIDLDEDGSIAPNESAAAIIAALSPGGSAQGTDAAALTFRYDRADGYWLQGYANFLMAQADFWLAHDFSGAFNGSFHMFFPRANLPLQTLLVPMGPDSGNIFSSEWRLADLISFVHYINWPVAEPDRRRAAWAELKEMIRLSRENWKAIRAEVDNDREWLPGPQQKGIHPLTGVEVQEAHVQAWLATLQIAEDMLDGRSLVPHFRFADKGIDLKKFFQEPQTFDLVLLLTGPGAVPYLKDGRILTSEEFWALPGQFGSSGFLLFALWFN